MFFSMYYMLKNWLCKRTVVKKRWSKNSIIYSWTCFLWARTETWHLSTQLRRKWNYFIREMTENFMLSVGCQSGVIALYEMKRINVRWDANLKGLFTKNQTMCVNINNVCVYKIHWTQNNVCVYKIHTNLKNQMHVDNTGKSKGDHGCMVLPKLLCQKAWGPARMSTGWGVVMGIQVYLVELGFKSWQ